MSQRYNVLLTLKGDRPLQLVRRIRELVPSISISEAGKIVHGQKPQHITVAGLDRAQEIVQLLHNISARAIITDEQGNVVDYEAVTAEEQFNQQKARTAAEAVWLEQEKARFAEKRRVERESAFAVELPSYHRYVFFPSDSAGTISQEARDRLRSLEDWCRNNLKGLYRLRPVVRTTNSIFSTIEVTNDMDAIFVKMWWEDDFCEIRAVDDEWIWQSPSRLFGNNPPSLAYDISRQAYAHPSGEAYRFVEGVQTGIGTTYVEPTFTKENLIALAPNESQRGTLLKYCADYDVLIHSMSDPISDSVVDDVIFNAIVSLDDEQLASFNAIWSSAFSRFKLDSKTNALLAVTNAHTSTGRNRRGERIR